MGLVADDDHAFAELLSRIGREVTLRQAADVCCGDLTLEQFQTLQAVGSAPSPSIGALSTQLRVDVSTMSRNVSLLEQNGYLLRARSEQDGRIVLVRLTAKGTRALQDLRCGERDVLSNIYLRIPPRERATIVRSLATLLNCLEAEAESAAASFTPVTIRKRRP